MIPPISQNLALYNSGESSREYPMTECRLCVVMRILLGSLTDILLLCASTRDQ